MKRSGHADLPLHGGHVPPWLAGRMQQLGTAVTESIVLHYGRVAFLERLSDPFWFQAFGAVMGMDWHSSGITTSVMAALKRGLNPIADELGIYVCGGRGRQSRKTPNELLVLGDRTGVDAAALVRTSKLTAKIDNNAVADGFQLYLHCFVLTREGDWAVVQQGMNEVNGLARRYHWHSPNVRDFVCDPHTGIVGRHQGTILNLVDGRARQAQDAMLRIVNQPPEKTRYQVIHEVREDDVNMDRLAAVLAVAYERNLNDFASLLLMEKLGPRTLQTLALVAEVIHGAPTRFSDPARFSFALGGKDGHPFPVPLKTYDESLSVLRRGLEKAKTGDSLRTDGLRRLDRLVRTVETEVQPSADFEKVLEQERAISPSLGGRMVGEGRTSARRGNAQLSLF